jgi:hypothetical protein
MTNDLLALVDWLREAACGPVVMESTGVYTLPTMLYIVGSALYRVGRYHRSQPKHDTNVTLLDLDPLEQRPNELAARLPISIPQPDAHLSGELFQLADEETYLAFDLGFLMEALRFCFQLLDAFPEAESAVRRACSSAS